MYKKFCLKNVENRQGQIAGYHWERENPKFVVCIVHGIGEYAGRYDRVAGFMLRAGFAVISMDLRGHGESFGKRGHCAPRTEVRKDIDDLIRYARKIYPAAPVVLYGHSMGGNLVLDYRKQGDLNAIPAAYIVSAPWIELARAVPKPLYVLVRGLSKLMPSFAISTGISSQNLGHVSSVGEYDRDPLVHMKITALCAVEGYETGKAMAEGKLQGNGGAEGKPLLLMHGTEDRVCSINGSRMIANVEDCDYIEWPGLYHEIHNGGPESTGEEVIRQVIRWIRAL